jgi:hypothetical protein
MSNLKQKHAYLATMTEPIQQQQKMMRHLARQREKQLDI